MSLEKEQLTAANQSRANFSNRAAAAFNEARGGGLSAIRALAEMSDAMRGSAERDEPSWNQYRSRMEQGRREVGSNVEDEALFRLDSLNQNQQR